ncbi:MAG: rhomboid family intramembrane serine protease [Candidatus Micrarchaeia archaeon]
MVNHAYGFQPRQGQYWLYILVATVAIFFIEIAFQNEIISLFAFTPALALLQPWTFVTAMFLHGGIMHLIFNMFALFMFGPLLEQRIGSQKFLALYFAAGILGSLIHLVATFALNADPMIPAIGASGAIYGILGAVAVLEPNLIIYMMFIPMPMWLAAFVWVFIEFASLGNVNSPIANGAHIGGMFSGFAYAFYLKQQAARFVDQYEYYE